VISWFLKVCAFTCNLHRYAAAGGARGSIATWEPYRLFPTHQPRRGKAPPDFVATGRVAWRFE
jgi:hypothetical protein